MTPTYYNLSANMKPVLVTGHKTSVFVSLDLDSIIGEVKNITAKMLRFEIHAT